MPAIRLGRAQTVAAGQMAAAVQMDAAQTAAAARALRARAQQVRVRRVRANREIARPIVRTASADSAVIATRARRSTIKTAPFTAGPTMRPLRGTHPRTGRILLPPGVITTPAQLIA